MTARTDAPSAEVRIRVMKRDRFQCTYCGTPGTDAELEIDHITPVSKGGSHHMANLTTSCRKCNQSKGNRIAATPKPGTPRTPASSDGIVGMFFHSLRPKVEGSSATPYSDDAVLHWQGYVLAREGDVALLQMFSWLDGRETNVDRAPIADLLDRTKFVLYRTNEQMNDAYERMELRRGRR